MTPARLSELIEEALLADRTAFHEDGDPLDSIEREEDGLLVVALASGHRIIYTPKEEWA